MRNEDENEDEEERWLAITSDYTLGPVR